MNCPEHLVFKSPFLSVWMYWADVPRERIPLKIWLNPLRYEICVKKPGRRLLTINREGMWWGRLKWFFVKYKYPKADRT